MKGKYIIIVTRNSWSISRLFKSCFLDQMFVKELYDFTLFQIMIVEQE